MRADDGRAGREAPSGRPAEEGPGCGLLAAEQLADPAGGGVGRLGFTLGGRGIAFYDLTVVGRPKPYKDAYRRRLDALDLAPEEIGRVVAEVRIAFGLNQALLAELGRDLAVYRR